MCSPALAIGGAGLGLQILGGQQQAGVEANNLRFEAAVANTNAAIAEQTARDIREAGHDAEVQQLRRVRALTGAQRAGYAAGNVDANTGTALDVIAESAGEGEADASRIRSNAIREAFGYESRAVQERAKSSYLKSSARAVKRAGIITGGGQALAGGYKLWQGR